MMIKDTIDRIENQIKSAANLSDEKRAELGDLIEKLRGELDGLPETEAEKARSVAGFAEVTTIEAMKTEKDEQLLDLASQGLSSSIQSMEQNHPSLARIVNSICMALSDTGI